MDDSTIQRLLDAPLPELMAEAAAVRDEGHPRIVTFSPKVLLLCSSLATRRCCCFSCLASQHRGQTHPKYTSVLSFVLSLQVCTLQLGAAMHCQQLGTHWLVHSRSTAHVALPTRHAVCRSSCP